MLESQNEQPQRGEMCPAHREQTIYSPSGATGVCIIEEIGRMTVILLVQTIIQVYKKLSKL